jgi:hypothetical protein
MAVAVSRPHFGPNHPMACIAVLEDVVGIDRLDEAGPAAAAVELVERGEKRLARHDVHIKSGFLITPVLIFKGPLGAVLLYHSVLLRVEPGQSLGVLVIGLHMLFSFPGDGLAVGRMTPALQVRRLTLFATTRDWLFLRATAI